MIIVNVSYKVLLSVFIGVLINNYFGHEQVGLCAIDINKCVTSKLFTIFVKEIINHIFRCLVLSLAGYCLRHCPFEVVVSF